MPKNEKPEKPLLWGDSRSDIERFDPRLHGARGTDPSRIPGYSEIVQANSIAAADELTFRTHQEKFGLSGHMKSQEDAYKLIGARPQPLPVEFKWLPASGPGGGALSPAAAGRLDNYQHKQGFSRVRVDTADPEKSFREQFGYGFPPAGRVEADGSIRRGSDVALYVRSGEVARMWEQHYAELAAEAEGSRLPEAFQDGNYTSATVDEGEERSVEYINHR